MLPGLGSTATRRSAREIRITAVPPLALNRGGRGLLKHYATITGYGHLAGANRLSDCDRAFRTADRARSSQEIRDERLSRRHEIRQQAESQFLGIEFDGAAAPEVLGRDEAMAFL